MSESEILKDLINIGFIRMVDGVPLRDGIDDNALQVLKSIECGENNVIIAGYVKTGNHFLLQILGQLGGYAREDFSGFLLPIKFEN